MLDQDKTKYEKILIVANRLPVTIHMDERNYHFSQSPGGLASALSSLKDKYEMEWLGWPGEVDLTFINKDELTEELQSEYNATPIFLTRSHLYHYHFGFSNRALWHILYYLPSLYELRRKRLSSI
ncbi:MAG: hypothetical protein KatS3mg129_0503 [Leptospiraceae bacterium]|nr:MAG: hypothetical protein KatS3mg129_0503 [Leptospiraceae bacterium]